MNDHITPILPSVASLRIGGPLGWLETMCLTSFVTAGHPVTLYSYDPIANLPGGVTAADAREIWTPPNGLLEATAPAYLADIFRIFLMEKTDHIWVDTDVLCLKPLTISPGGYLLGWTPWQGEINNAVMRMPADSPLFREFAHVATDLDVIPNWLRPAARNKLAETPREERDVMRFRLRRTVLGPAALTYLAQRHVPESEINPPEVLSPVPWQFSDVLFNPGCGTEAWITEQSCAVHLWSQMIGRHKKWMPYDSSFVGTWLSRLGLRDALDLPQYPTPEPHQDM